MSEATLSDGATSTEASRDFLSGGSEMGALMRAHDWSKTPLGDPAGWPHSLKAVVRVLLTSRFAMWMAWGPELTFFCNDAYLPTLRIKRDRVLGERSDQVWAEIWPDIGPRIRRVLDNSEATWDEALLLYLERSGFREETYHTFSYSPLTDEGATVGMLCVVAEVTERILGERQLATLRDLGSRLAGAATREEVMRALEACLGAEPRDVPFAQAYLLDEPAAEARLAAVHRLNPGAPAARATVAMGADGAIWPFDHVLEHGPQSIEIAPEDLGDFSIEYWQSVPQKALIVPIGGAEGGMPLGFFVAGLNPHRALDTAYRGFIELLAGQLAAAVARADAYERERARAQALAELDRAKTTFFSNVSHEFRTPLTLMLGPIEDVLNDSASTALAPIHRNRLETAHRNSLRLLKLVNSLLDFSRIEAGRVGINFEPVDLGKLTTDLVSNFESATEKAGLALRIDCPDFDQPVYVDRDMWEKIVLNLVSNAFKFTFEGEIAVVLRRSADRQFAELTVRDTGVGIPEAELPRLFERFHRIEGQRSRSFEGSGIGLALVQELVKLHGGSIRADSEVGKGTAFTISIPFGTARLPASHDTERSRISTALRAEAFLEEALRWLPAGEAITDAPEDRADDTSDLLAQGRTDGARILIADDNADMRNYVRRLLGSRWEVETVTDGQEALEAIRRQKPDLLLTDVMMPRLDGFGLLQELRNDHDLRDLPVIMLSARAGEEARVEGLDAGADDYLTKPFSARELIARVNANLEMARLRREAMRDLRESEARFRNMAEHAPVMMWMTDATGSLTYSNHLWSEFTGQAAGDALGFGAWKALHPDDLESSRRMFLEANAARAPFRIEYRLGRADGTYRWALSAAAPRFGDDGEFLGYIGSVIDIEDRKEAERILREANVMLEQRVSDAIAERAQAEAQLRQAQKMEAVGKLTGGVAHDFNNVLQVIAGNLQLLTRDIAGNLRAEQRLQTAIAAISRGSKLASQLLAFGRRQPLAPKVIHIGRLIRSIDDMLRRALGEGIEIETMIAGGLWNTFVDTVQVENALLNLAINARDAMEGHGKLTIEAGNAFLDDDYAGRHAEVTSGQYVMIAVTDTGCGIPPDIIEQVFDPFFTTKPEGQGTGLGLSMVYGFVKQSGGHIKIYSEPGQGTTIRIYLPRTREAEDVETDIETGPATGGMETILVVEDDEDVRSTVVDILSDLGYRVLKAKDASSALAIIESGVPIDLLFTDVVMPGPLRSPELARKAQERLPGIAVLFTSGYTENAIVHGGRLDERIELLSKPYTREAMARKIRHVLRNQQQRVLTRTGSLSLSGRRADGDGAGFPTRALRVLLVEDDALIRLSTADMLTSLGYSVTEAANGKVALELLDKGLFDVIVTDLALPDMSGEEIAARAVKQQPGLRVIFATGYETLPRTRRLDGFEVTAFLRKPYDEQQIATALKKAISLPDA